METSALGSHLDVDLESGFGFSFQDRMFDHICSVSALDLDLVLESLSSCNPGRSARRDCRRQDAAPCRYDACCLDAGHLVRRQDTTLAAMHLATPMVCGFSFGFECGFPFEICIRIGIRFQFGGSGLEREEK